MTYDLYIVHFLYIIFYISCICRVRRYVRFKLIWRNYRGHDTNLIIVQVCSIFKSIQIFHDMIDCSLFFILLSHTHCMSDIVWFPENFEPHARDIYLLRVEERKENVFKNL